MENLTGRRFGKLVALLYVAPGEDLVVGTRYPNEASKTYNQKVDLTFKPPVEYNQIKFDWSLLDEQSEKACGKEANQDHR